MHRRSQDFLWRGCTLFLKKVDDLFSRRPKNIPKTDALTMHSYAPNIPTHQKFHKK